MRLSALCLFPFALACGAADDQPNSTEVQPEVQSEQEATGAFDPPPPPEGYTRIVTPVMPDLEPGAHVMYCQYVMAPVDRDLDILDVSGHQSLGGHHAVAYATTVDQPVGTSGPCTEEDNLASNFLGGIGGEAGSGVKLPEGVAFRLSAGNAIMLNTHFLNTTTETIDGESVLDIKFAEVDPDREVASLFVNGRFDFTVPAMGQQSAVAECVVPHDIEFIFFGNHMHDQGDSAMTEIERADGTIETVHEDPVWTYDMQFNGNLRAWDVNEPLLVQAGDTIRTFCNWNNALDEELTFPREMCIGLGYFLATDNYSSPVCYNGDWVETE